MGIWGDLFPGSEELMGKCQYRQVKKKMNKKR